jgi:hypothetical protein
LRQIVIAAVLSTALYGCGGGDSTAPAPTYGVGGTVSGLNASGLVLVNDNDTLTVASNASTFTFPTALPSGSSYSVSVKTDPQGLTCTLGKASGTMASAAVTNITVTCLEGLFKWAGGSNTANAPGVYGTRGVAAASNIPGARWGAISWTDAAGNVWLFGGVNNPWNPGLHGSPPSAPFNDLWELNASTGEWTWVSGASATNASGVYGTLRTAAAGNVPGARFGAVSWIDAQGNLWLFSGFGNDSAGNYGDLNDLWQFSPSSGQWAWMGGSNTVLASAVYGTQGIAAAGNIPGPRSFGAAWVDGSGNFWLFGGGALVADLNPGVLDFWKYSPSTGLWTWIGGGLGANPSYGMQGMSAASNLPPARLQAATWTDSAGTLWMFGGLVNMDDMLTFNFLNDLWKFDPVTGEWTWVSGSSTANALGSYGMQGVAASSNEPGARYGTVSWTDKSGILWLYGGDGLVPTSVLAGITYQYNLSDVWKFDPGSGQWTWAGGPQTSTSGIYGTLGTAAAANAPPGRYGAVSWIDAGGNLCLFGGESESGTNSYNDVWEFTR